MSKLGLSKSDSELLEEIRGVPRPRTQGFGYRNPNQPMNPSYVVDPAVGARWVSNRIYPKPCVIEILEVSPQGTTITAKTCGSNRTRKIHIITLRSHYKPEPLET